MNKRYYYKKINGKGVSKLLKPSTNPNDIEITEAEYNEILRKRATKKTSTETEKFVMEAKTYLAKTDYIVIKIAEAQAEGNTALVESLRNAYATELAKRKEKRAFINNYQ